MRRRSSSSARQRLPYALPPAGQQGSRATSGRRSVAAQIALVSAIRAGPERALRSPDREEIVPDRRVVTKPWIRREAVLVETDLTLRESCVWRVLRATAGAVNRERGRQLAGNEGTRPAIAGAPCGGTLSLVGHRLRGPMPDPTAGQPGPALMASAEPLDATLHSSYGGHVYRWKTRTARLTDRSSRRQRVSADTACLSQQRRERSDTGGKRVSRDRPETMNAPIIP